MPWLRAGPDLDTPLTGCDHHLKIPKPGHFTDAAMWLKAGLHAEVEGEEPAKGSRSAWLEQQYRERMEAILEGMQDGPLFQVMPQAPIRVSPYERPRVWYEGFACRAPPDRNLTSAAVSVAPCQRPNLPQCRPSCGLQAPEHVEIVAT